MNHHEKKAQVTQIFDLFNSRDLDAIDAIFDPEFVDHGSIGDVQGLPAFKELLRTLLAGFPDARFEVSNIIVEGDLAAWQARFTGTNSGALMGMPPTGRAVDVLGLHMGRLGDGNRPIEHWTGNDELAMMHQLGLSGGRPGQTL
jgi:predicted ester cyclase